MTRRGWIGGNWKLHNTVAESVDLAQGVRRRLEGASGKVEVVLGPVFTALWSVSEVLQGCDIQLMGQDLFYEQGGAYTGAVSGPHVRSAGCQYVLVGHSERRQYFGETVASTHLRLKAALASDLIPVLCIGETLEQREQGATEAVLEEQLLGALGDVSPEGLQGWVIAYEPVWAIGTGHAATEQQAQEAHGFIRALLRRRDVAWGDATRVVYGGSVKPQNAGGFLAQPDVDGALVGGASLKVEDFAAIVEQAS